MTQPNSVLRPAGSSVAARGALPWVVLCGIVSLGLYLLMPGFFARLTSSEPSFTFEAFSWVKAVTRATLDPIRGRPDNLHASMPYLFCFAALFAIYAALLFRAKSWCSVRIQAAVFAFGTVFLGVCLFSSTMLSTDVFAYAFYGRLVSVYKTDAYLAAASFNPSDPFYLLYGHNFFGSVYGPLWTLLSAGITKFSGDRVGLTVFLFRLLAAGSIFVSAALIWDILRRRCPERATQGLVLFLWNPLVIMETAANCHNDATLMALLLLGIWLHVRGWRPAALVALTLGVLVKAIAAPLLLLYAWTVLRESPSWRDRLLFLARSAAGAVLAAGLIYYAANAKATPPVSKLSNSPDFYLNNFHEILFNRLRRVLGEDPETIMRPMYFWSWWEQAIDDTVIRSKPGDDAPVVRQVKKGELVLVIAQQYSRWVRVYDPGSRRRGFILVHAFEPLDDPPRHAPDAEAARLEPAPVEMPTVILANRIIRTAMPALFAAFGLLAAWKTTNFDRFLIWGCAVFAAIYLTVATQIWPWYVIWTLALGALKPTRAPARLAVLLSAGMPTLYGMIGFGMSSYDGMYALRSIPAIVIPVAVWLLWEARRLYTQRQRADLSAKGTAPM